MGAIVFREEVLLGAAAMEDLDLVICPATQSVDVNPESPNLPTAPIKQTRRPNRPIGTRRVENGKQVLSPVTEADTSDGRFDKVGCPAL